MRIRETRRVLTAPELTRLSAIQPRIRFAGIVSNAEEVLTQVSGGIELALKPGRNIIDDEQPRGLYESVKGGMPVQRPTQHPIDRIYRM